MHICISLLYHILLILPSLFGIHISDKIIASFNTLLFYMEKKENIGESYCWGKCQENTIEFLEKIFLTSFKSKFRVVILTSWCEKYSTTYTTYKNTRLRYIS